MIGEAWFALLGAAGPCTRRWPALLGRFGSAEALISQSAAVLASHGVAETAIRALHEPDRSQLARWRAWLDAEPHRGLITLGSAEYPRQLLELENPPLALWYHGIRSDLLRGPQLAIVGSRSCTRTGAQTAEQFARAFSSAGLTITSGLAVGIDAASHRGALHGVGGTIAVLGSGADRVFPRDNQTLAREIVDRGLIVSELPPGTGPRPHHFPQRNRIIAGLALGTLVVEATRRSGSLLTARCAFAAGRDVFAVPGSIHSPLARGCHALIRAGARLVETTDDVLGELRSQLQLELATPEAAPHLQSQAAEQTLLTDDQSYHDLLNCLEFSPISINDIAACTGLTAAELSSMLLLLEMEGYVEALPGGRYARTAKGSR